MRQEGRTRRSASSPLALTLNGICYLDNNNNCEIIALVDNNKTITNYQHRDSMMTTERMRFSPRDDIVLLREVITLNPYADNSVWPELSVRVRTQTNKKFTTRALKDHLKHLLLLWEKEDWAKLRRSGCEEIYVEKEFLIQQVTELKECYRSIKANDLETTVTDLENLERKAAAITQATFCLESQHTDNVSYMTVPVEAETVIVCDEEVQDMEVEPQAPPTIVGSTSINPIELPSPPCAIPQIKEEKDPIRKTMSTPSGRQIARKLGLAPNFITAATRRKLQQPTARSYALKFLEKKSRREMALHEAKLQFKERELRFKEEQLKLDREIFEQDKKERETRLRIETERNEQFSRQQQLLIELLKEKLSK